MDDGLIVIDAIGRIVDLNPPAQALIGMTRSEAIGREARQVLSEHSSLRQLLDDPVILHTEIQTRTPSRWYEARLSSLLDTRGFRLGQLILLVWAPAFLPPPGWRSSGWRQKRGMICNRCTPVRRMSSLLTWGCYPKT